MKQKKTYNIKSVKKSTKKQSKKPLIIVAGVVAALLILGGGAWALTSRQADNPVVTEDTASDPEEPKIDLSPPTDEDKQAVDEHKEELGNEPTPTPPPSSGKQAVTPLVVSANYNATNQIAEIHASVNIVEEGGTCTASLSMNGQTVAGEGSGIADAKQSICYVAIPRSRLSAGNWKVTMAYNSTRAEGISTNESSVAVQ